MCYEYVVSDGGAGKSRDNGAVHHGLRHAVLQFGGLLGSRDMWRIVPAVAMSRYGTWGACRVVTIVCT